MHLQLCVKLYTAFQHLLYWDNRVGSRLADCNLPLDFPQVCYSCYIVQMFLLAYHSPEFLSRLEPLSVNFSSSNSNRNVVSIDVYTPYTEKMMLWFLVKHFSMQTVYQIHVVFQKYKYVLFSYNSVYWNIHLEKYLLSQKYISFCWQ